MAETVLRVLGRDIAVACTPAEERRLRDLAAALDARLAGQPDDEAGVRQLVLVALGLMDDAQAAGAALVRAQVEIERLSDMIADARLANAGLPPRPEFAARARST